MYNYDPEDDENELEELENLNGGPGYQYNSMEEFYEDQEAFNPIDWMD